LKATKTGYSAENTRNSVIHSKNTQMHIKQGWAIWLVGHFEKTALSSGPYFLMEIEASIV